MGEKEGAKERKRETKTGGVADVITMIVIIIITIHFVSGET
jgi:hypothetical protein